MEYFSIDDLESSVTDDIKKVHSKIQEKVSDYSCECPSGTSGRRKKKKKISINNMVQTIP